MGKRGTGEWCRWHRYDSTGVKEQRCFPRGVEPTQEEGYTVWTRGTGRPTATALANMREAIRRACLGVPKSQQHREKMRQAKLGVPKSPQHRENMSRAHKLRIARLKGKEYADTENNTQW